MDFAHVCNFAEPSRDRRGRLLPLLGYTRLTDFVVKFGDLSTHGGIDLLNTGIVGDCVPDKVS